MMKPSPPNRPTPIFFWKAMPIDTPAPRRGTSPSGRSSVPPSCRQIHREDLPGYGAANATPLLAGGLVGEHRHEQALAGQDALAGAEQRADDAAALLLTAVAEDRLHLDAGRHVHHRAGLGDGALARIELDLDELHVLAEDLEVDLVGAPAGAGCRDGAGGTSGTAAQRRPTRGSAVQPAATSTRRELRNGTERRPVLHAGREQQRFRIDAAVVDVRSNLVRD